jgi:hypothetical protein
MSSPASTVSCLMLSLMARVAATSCKPPSIHFTRAKSNRDSGELTKKEPTTLTREEIIAIADRVAGLKNEDYESSISI